MSWGRYSQWAPYVPAAQKKANGSRSAAALAKKQGRAPSPVKIEGRKIATSFWGISWCNNLESYSDFSNRLPRGATYVRNGSVVDLVIKPRLIEALVAGSETYQVKITIEALPKSVWSKVKQDCSASIDSLLDLLSGRFSDGVMQRLTRQKDGLFPAPKEIKMQCSCPDYSYCCKHLAAVMYGIGHRLDHQPELLFLLRDVDHQELVSEAVADGNLDRELAGAADNSLADADLGALFGIELESGASQGTSRKKGTKAARKATSAPTKKATVAPSATVVPQTLSTKKTKTVKPTSSTKTASSSKKSVPVKGSPTSQKSVKASPAVASRKPSAKSGNPSPSAAASSPVSKKPSTKKSVAKTGVSAVPPASPKKRRK